MVNAQSDCLLSVAQTNGDTILVTMAEIRSLATSTAGSTLRDIDGKFYYSTSHIDTLIEYSNGNFVRFTDAADSKVKAFGKKFIKSVAETSSGKARITTTFVSSTYLTTEDYSAIEADLIACITAGSGGGADLSFTRNATTVTVLSDSGTDAVLPVATTSLAGIMSSTLFTFLGRVDTLPSAQIFVGNGSSIPTAVELENTLGALTFTRSSTGTYTIASSGLFTTGQVWASPKWSTLRQGSNYATVLLSLANVNQLTLTTYLDGVAADALLTDFPIEIRVYL